MKRGLNTDESADWRICRLAAPGSQWTFPL
jgi:hypothetical protein